MTLRRIRRAGRGLRVGGLISLITGYSFGLITIAYDPSETLLSLIPVIGPFISGGRLLGRYNSCMSTAFDCDDTDKSVGGVSIFLGFLQVAGLAMTIGGYVKRRRVRQRLLAQPQVALLPMGTRDGAGLSLTATF